MKALLVGVPNESAAVVEHAIGTYGYDQSVAETGTDALELVRKSSPALVIVQDALSDMTAVDFCRRVRACPNGRDAIVLVIAHDLDDLQSLLDAGATDLHAMSLGPAALEVRLQFAKRLVRQHEKLRNRELRFRRLFESGVAGITISDLDHNFKEVNDAFLKMLGYTRENMQSGELTWGAISPLDRLVSDTEDRVKLQSEGFLPLREREYVHKDGRRVAALEGSAILDGTTECISYVADISVREREVAALRASVVQYRALFDRSPLPKFLYDNETLRILAVNDAAVRNYGYSHAAFLRMAFDEIRSENPGEAPLQPAGGGGPASAPSGSWKHKKKDGSVIDVDITIQEFALGDRPCSLAIAADVTDRNRMELQLRQAQKMDAVGSLAGGIAHDFNNMLSVILSYGEMMTAELTPGDPNACDLAEIMAAANRAAALTRQLLIFSRQQILQPKVLDLNLIVDSLAKMLTRLVGEDLELNVVNAPGLGRVTVDAGQIEQVLMNLVVNARDAMPKGGRLTIETANVEVDAAASTHAGVAPGSYVMLTVTDTGLGMSAATRERIFEPFFTTKPRGKGTGLGLSTVFGIVQQSGGGLKVASELGRGTVFTVYLPRAAADRDVLRVAVTEPRAKRGRETVLVVEDEESVRTVIRRVLQREGYSVLESRSGADALALSDQHAGRIDLLLTDVVMPHMSGRELAEQLCPQRPEMKVLYISGYTDDSIIRHGVLHSSVAFLQKPVTPDALTKKLREVIDSPAISWRAGPPISVDDSEPSAAPSHARMTDADPTSGTFGVVGAAESPWPLHRRGT
jgi:two-component system cell cycle sensor histidine kinase/response regulator CckA